MQTFNEAETTECRRILEWGLVEDLQEVGDLTSQSVIDPSTTASALIVPRKDGVVAGLPALPILAAMRDFGVEIELLAADGPIHARSEVARLSGSLRGILAMERLALNLLSRLSGVATLTARYVAAVAGSQAKVCDTRKTTPGYRRLEKYAVRVGGGTNHRMGLFDGVLIKDNHLAGIAETEQQPVAAAVRRAREAVGDDAVVEVEVDTLEQLEEALSASPTIVLLDNMAPPALSSAVEMRNRLSPRTLLEASGGVDLKTIGAIAASGVDRISVGALTHSAPALDLGLDYEIHPVR